ISQTGTSSAKGQKGSSVTADVRFGSQADIGGAKTHVCFTPNSDRESGLPQTVMSALLPKADMCSAVGYVRFGPKADSCSAAKRSLFDHLVSAAAEAERKTSRRVGDM